MNFLRTIHRDGSRGNRGLINWSDDGKEEFFALEVVIGNALARLQEVDPSWFAHILLSDNAKTRELIEAFLSAPIMDFDESGNSYK